MCFFSTLSETQFLILYLPQLKHHFFREAFPDPAPTPGYLQVCDALVCPLTLPFLNTFHACNYLFNVCLPLGGP